MNNKNRHAYLIIAHNQAELLYKLLELLDNVSNDIYIHIDKKFTNFNYEECLSVVNKSKLYFVKRQNVTWGGDSLIKCTMNLLKYAFSQKKYTYYHLISGVDLPLKSQNYIHSFFEKNSGKQFIVLDEKANSTFSFVDRINKYYFFQNILGRKEIKGIYKFFHYLNKVSLYFQKIININRVKNNKKYYKGHEWFSLTQEFVEYLLNADIKEYYHTFCADEIFIPTILMNSPFKKDISSYPIRYIDWKRGGPYTFKNSDYDDLITCDALFARKFDLNVDKEIIDRIYNYVKTTE